MTGFHTNVEADVRANTNFRKVIYTAATRNMQLVLMSLKPLEEIGAEVHPTVDQFFRFEAGEGKVVMNGEETLVKDGDVVVVPAGTQHNVINTSTIADLKLYTIYTPANHPEGTIHATKADAMAAEAAEHGK